MATNEKITVDPMIMLGKPCIVGTRITVEIILEDLGRGYSFDDVLYQYPQLKIDDVRACLTYAAHSMSNRRSA